MSTKTFRHAGDRGDIVYSLPVIRALGGGALYVEAADFTREKLTPEKWRNLASLLEAQPYIHSVREWQGQPCDVNLNDFRARLFPALSRREPDAFRRNLADWHLLTHGLPIAERDTAWLAVQPRRVARFVLNRTGHGRPPWLRYHDPRFPWEEVLDAVGREAVFIGTPDEHVDLWSRYHATLPFYETPSFLDVAQVIAGSDWFIGNQSCAYAIAEALKHKAVLEVCPGAPNCLFHRPNVFHGWPGLDKLSA